MSLGERCTHLFCLSSIALPFSITKTIISAIFKLLFFKHYIEFEASCFLLLIFKGVQEDLGFFGEELLSDHIFLIFRVIPLVIESFLSYVLPP